MTSQVKGRKSTRESIAAAAAESWDFHDADTQHVTHSIHRYSGKFIPQIANRAISLLTQPGELVLDPYCGSGTTLLEAALLGRRALGVDLSPLATLIAECKITPVGSTVLNSLTQYFRDLVAAIEGTEQGLLFPATNPPTVAAALVAADARLRDPWFTKWFQRDILRDLVLLDHAIWQIPHQAPRNLARVAFSEILRRSSNAHSGYPNVMFDKHAPRKARPGRDFLRSLERVVALTQTLPTSVSWSGVSTVRGDAQCLPLADESVHAVVTHPPYIGSIPYAEYGALSLKWLGHTPSELDMRLTGGKRQSKDVVNRFEAAYGAMLRESRRVLRTGRHLFVMVGSPVVRGDTVDLSQMTKRLAARAELRLVAETTRNGVNRRANKMGSEHLLFFEKPASV